MPVPGSPGGMALTTLEPPAPRYCWRNHLKPARVMPATDPNKPSVDWSSLPATKDVDATRDWTPNMPEMGWGYSERVVEGAQSLNALGASSEVCRLMRFEAECHKTIAVIQEQIVATEADLINTARDDEPANAPDMQTVHQRLTQLKTRKADAVAHLDETFANLAVITEELGCHAYYGGTIHSHHH